MSLLGGLNKGGCTAWDAGRSSGVLGRVEVLVYRCAFHFLCRYGGITYFGKRLA
jgi:hypothetical protein